jgi:micrococcal nuclease
LVKFLWLLCCFCCSLPLLAAPAAPISATVRYVIDGDTLVTMAGEHVRLLDINSPEPARHNRPAEPMAVEAKALLETHLMGQAIWLEIGGQSRDRYGRLLAHVTRQADNWWANGALVKTGLAHTYTFPDNALRAAELHELEAQALAQQRGLWGTAYFPLRDAQSTWPDDALGRFAVTDGRVVSSQQVRDTIYLNFGPDWRTDFSVAINHADWPRFEQAGIDPRVDYRGKNVRVRGVALPVNGVLVTVTHPAQLEILAE